MVFSSLIFAFFFLPVVLILYYLSKEKYRNYILLIASLYFYSYGEPKFVFVMAGLHIPQELRIRSGGTERHSASN